MPIYNLLFSEVITHIGWQLSKSKQYHTGYLQSYLVNKQLLGVLYLSRLEETHTGNI